MSEVNKPEQDDIKSPAQVDYEQGLTFLNDKDIAQAAAAFHNALLGYEQEKDENGVANAAMRLADICITKKDYDKALKHCETAYAICEKHSDRLSLLTIEAKRATIFHEWGKYEEAIPRYVDLIDEYNAMRNPQATVETLETLAKIYMKVQDREKAADCYNTIASIHKAFKHDNFYNKYTQKAEELLT